MGLEKYTPFQKRTYTLNRPGWTRELESKAKFTERSLGDETE
jgi:hypothetical protein